jgi:histone-lysine N-methyltransferase SETD3
MCGEGATRLLRWLERHGASSAPLTIASDPRAGRAVVAAAPIAADDVVLRIPLRLLLTTRIARASAVGRAIAASIVPPPGNHTFLAAYLLQERGKPRARFRPYLDSLPAAFPTLPIFFGPRELALLEGSSSLEKIAYRRAALRRDHRALRRAVPAFRSSLDDFVWARSCVITRVFGLTIGGHKTEVLVPLADMLNHERDAETHWTYDDGAGAFVLTARRDFRAGEPVHDSYGRKSNARFFVHYGFTLDDNDGDEEAVIRLALPRDAPLAAEKSRLLDAVPGRSRAVQIPAFDDEDGAVEALSFLRVACATPRELELLTAVPLDVRRVPPVNGRNESTAMGLLAAACDEALRAFPTTVEQDDDLLREGALSPNARNAVVMRRGEKRVLSRFIRLARAAAPLLRLPLSSLAQAVVEGAAGGGEARRYLAAVVVALSDRRRTALDALRAIR